MVKNNDARIVDFYEINDINGQYTAYSQGDYNATSTEYPVGSTSRAKLAATDPVYFMSHAEVEFLQAEAWARLNNVSKAQSHYESAVKLAFSRWGKDAAPYIETDGAYVFRPGTVELMVEQIITQKWVASTRCQAWDAFYDQNRTGYPIVSTVPGNEDSYVPGQYTPSLNTSLVGNELPRRLPYPKVSSDNNPNTPKVVSINTKMWWHKK
ncbi:Starch-binding associating with outer membrane [compost metagenome]